MRQKYHIKAVQYEFPPESIDTIVENIRDLLENGGYLTQGQHAALFENEFASYVGTPHAVSTNSGTGALEIALRAVGVGGGEVIVTTNTFAATVFAILRAGATPVFVDILDDLSLDPDEIRLAMTAKTRAVVIVHVGGFVSPSITEVMSTCQEHGITLIEDAAHAHGSRLAENYAGSFGQVAAFSFFPTKVITSAEGGMLTTSSADIAACARVLRDQAKISNSNRHEAEGYNWRMSELHAILGRVQLSLIEQFITERSAVAAAYDSLLGQCSPLRRFRVSPNMRPNYYKYILFLDKIAPTVLDKILRSDFDVALGGYVYDLPCHLQPVFRQYYRRPLENAEKLCSSHICLPIYPALARAPEQIEYVAAALTSAVASLVGVHKRHEGGVTIE